jgi:hypothetical protein
MVLGYIAWQGYLIHGRGLVLCAVQAADRVMDWQYEYAPCVMEFIPAAIASQTLARHLEYGALQSVTQAVASYVPEHDLIISLGSSTEPLSRYVGCWLRQAAIVPPDCYQYVIQTWSEFNIQFDQANRFRVG